MEEHYIISTKLKNITYVFMGIGVVTFFSGIFSNPAQTWANFLLNNYYFLSLSIGSVFFIAIQYITQSGWSAMFKRIPEAMGGYFPVAAVAMLILTFGSPYIYHWTHHEELANDITASHKSSYLNIPFFIIRVLIFFGAWIYMYNLLRKESLKEDLAGGVDSFHRSEFYSKVFIFILALTFSLGTIDWVMSIDLHWYSTIFALTNLVSGFYHAAALITLVVILLNERGFFKFLNKDHLHDFSKYIFILGIIWVYFWYSQYLLMWYANIPEETIYYVKRLKGGWGTLFYLNIILNWVIPFVVLLPNKACKNKMVLKVICFILFIGQWIDLYLQIMPGSVGEFKLGIIELGMFLGFIGLFILIFTKTLSKASLIPHNHPYLEESMYHHN